MSKAVVIGVTGISGSGKTLLCKALKRRGCAVIDCDRIARAATAKGSECLAQLAGTFGMQILYPSGRLNRRRLAAIAFSDPEKTEALNSVTHPWILAETERKLGRALRSGKTAVLDAPLLAECGLDRRCALTVVMKTDPQTAAERIMKRDGLTREEAMRRLGARAERGISGRTIYFENNGSAEDIDEFAGKLLEELETSGKERKDGNGNQKD